MIEKEDALLSVRWLVKSEPETWSWDQQVAAGITPWDGVRNFQAMRFLQAMEVGDLCFFYHSGKQRAIVGVVQVVRAYYPDLTCLDGKFGMVDVQTWCGLKAPISLSSIKQNSELSHLPLVRQSRLSVMPVDSQAAFILSQMHRIA